MSNELQAALTKLLESLLATAEKAVDLGAEQLPLVVQEYLAWGIAAAAVWAVFCTLTLIAGLAAMRWTWGNERLWDYLNEPAGIFLTLGSGCMVVGGIVGSITNTLTLIQITVAPRVYLIEQLRGML